MTRTRISGFTFEDASMVAGYVTVSDSSHRYPEYTMTIETYRALSRCVGANARLRDTLDSQRGTFLIPGHVIDPDVAEDVQLGLSIVEAEPSEWCLYPPCGLRSVTVRDGFPLCTTHDALSQSWDDLLT